MWSIEYVCSSLQSVIEVCQIRSTWDCFDHISLIQNRNHALFLLLDSLLIEEFFEKFLEFFINRIDQLGKISASSMDFS